jgi:hypothetical protein
VELPGTGLARWGWEVRASEVWLSILTGLSCCKSQLKFGYFFLLENHIVPLTLGPLSSGTPVETTEWELAHQTIMQQKLEKYLGTRWAVDLSSVFNHRCNHPGLEEKVV